MTTHTIAFTKSEYFYYYYHHKYYFLQFAYNQLRLVSLLPFFHLFSRHPLSHLFRLIILISQILPLILPIPYSLYILNPLNLKHFQVLPYLYT